MRRAVPYGLLVCLLLGAATSRPAHAQAVTWRQVGPLQAYTHLLAGPDGALYAYWAPPFFSSVRRSTDGGETWSELPGFGPLNTALAVDARGRLYHAHSYIRLMTSGALYRTDDLGQTRTRLGSDTEPAPAGFSPMVVKDLAFNARGDLFAATYQEGRPNETLPHGIFRSQDDGRTWQALTDRPLAPSGFQSIVTNGTGTLYASRDPAFSAPGTGRGTLVSHDDGATWVPVDELPFFRDRQPVVPLGVTREGRVLAFDQQAVYLVEADGSAGEAVLGIFPATYTQGANDHFFAADSSGVLYGSGDGGRAWTVLSEGVGWGGVYSVAQDRDGFLYTSTETGLYRSTSPATLVASEAEAAVPAAGLTLESYPNPFTREAVFRLSMPAPARATLRLYDLAGRRLATVFEGVLPAGSHRLPWAAGGLAGGAYVARLEAGGLVRTRLVVRL